MKKLFSYITIVLAAALALTSCDKNLPPIFDDATMAFVAFDETTVYVDEAVVNPDQTISQTANIRIPVTLASVAGLSETVTFTVEDGTAVSGTNFKLVNPSASLSFDKDNRTQYIEFEILYFDQFTGDLNFMVALDEPANINLGYNSECTIVIGDIDHPLSNLLGTYVGTVYSQWEEDYYDWKITLTKDENDVSMVWISNWDPFFASYGYPSSIYGIVNSDKTQITIPSRQEHVSAYDTAIVGFDTVDPWDATTDADIVILINEDGTLTVPNGWGVFFTGDGYDYVLDIDEEYYEVYDGGGVLKKQ